MAQRAEKKHTQKIMYETYETIHLVVGGRLDFFSDKLYIYEKME